jgi:hypothetical protein
MDTTTTELAATDAIGLAFDWFDRFFGDAAGGACVDNLLLEGVEYDERTNEWKISLRCRKEELCRAEEPYRNSARGRERIAFRASGSLLLFRCR